MNNSKFLVLALAKGSALANGQIASVTAYHTEEAALRQGHTWSVSGVYEVYIYTLAAKIRVRELPVIVDRSVETHLAPNEGK